MSKRMLNNNASIKVIFIFFLTLIRLTLKETMEVQTTTSHNGQGDVIPTKSRIAKRKKHKAPI